jgi:hypothetical protein
MTGMPAISRADAIRGAVGLHSRFCSAGWDFSIAVPTLRAEVVPNRLRSRTLRSTHAFDAAEGLLGQLNAVTVASFAGPRTALWGVDVAASDQLQLPALTRVRRHDGREIPVRPLRPVLDAGTALLSTYRCYPGTVMPCAMKIATAPGPCIVGSGLAIGIAERRGIDAADLFMEDTVVRRWPRRPASSRKWVADLAASVIEIGQQQQVLYAEILVGTVSVKVPRGHTGGAAAMVPYLALPRDAVPDDPADLLGMPLGAWAARFT